MKHRSKVSKKSILWITAAFLFIALGYILYRFFAFREGSESGPAETPAPPAETTAPSAETPAPPATPRPGCALRRNGDEWRCTTRKVDGSNDACKWTRVGPGETGTCS